MGIIEEKEKHPNQTSMETIAHVKRLQDSECDLVSWDSYLNWFKTPTHENANDRSWMYQTCSEFGFYQTCEEGSDCPYARGYHGIDQDLEFCEEIFGISKENVRKNIESTLSYYGGRSLSPASPSENNAGPALQSGINAGQKRLLFVTGEVDPWTELAYTSVGSIDHPSITVKGASHHFWTHMVKESDDKYIVAARKQIYDTVSSWLGVATPGGEVVLETA